MNASHELRFGNVQVIIDPWLPLTTTESYRAKRYFTRRQRAKKSFRWQRKYQTRTREVPVFAWWVDGVNPVPLIDSRRVGEGNYRESAESRHRF